MSIVPRLSTNLNRFAVCFHQVLVSRRLLLGQIEKIYRCIDAFLGWVRDRKHKVSCNFDLSFDIFLLSQFF